MRHAHACMRIFRFENKSGLSTIGFMQANAPLDSDASPCWQIRPTRSHAAAA
jgi:hypothetical protein